MSKLYGGITGDHALASTRTAKQHISAWVQNEQGRVEVELSGNGQARIIYYPVEQLIAGTGYVLVEGNVNTADFAAQASLVMRDKFTK